MMHFAPLFVASLCDYLGEGESVQTPVHQTLAKAPVTGLFKLLDFSVSSCFLNPDIFSLLLTLAVFHFPLEFFLLYCF